MKIRILLLFFTLLFTSICVANDDRYYFPNNQLSVINPRWIPDMSMTHKEDGKYADVTFVMGSGYWEEGGYSVQIFAVPAVIHDTNSFYKSTQDYFQRYMIKDKSTVLPNLKIYSTKRLKINGYPAYQAISFDAQNNPPGVYIATSIYMKKFIVIVSLIIPYTPQKQKAPSEQIPWSRYNQFMTSLR